MRRTWDNQSQEHQNKGSPQQKNTEYVGEDLDGLRHTWDTQSQEQNQRENIRIQSSWHGNDLPTEMRGQLNDTEEATPKPSSGEQ